MGHLGLFGLRVQKVRDRCGLPEVSESIGHTRPMAQMKFGPSKPVTLFLFGCELGVGCKGGEGPKSASKSGVLQMRVVSPRGRWFCRFDPQNHFNSRVHRGVDR